MTGLALLEPVAGRLVPSHWTLAPSILLEIIPATMQPIVTNSFLFSGDNAAKADAILLWAYHLSHDDLYHIASPWPLAIGLKGAVYPRLL